MGLFDELNELTKSLDARGKGAPSDAEFAQLEAGILRGA
jgi:hypothetical protein